MNLINTEEQADNQQGFFPEKLEIHSSEKKNRYSMEVIPHISEVFTVKYLNGIGTMKKQPLASLQHFSSYEVLGSSDTDGQLRKPKENDGHPYHLFASNFSYQLVYNKAKGEPILNEFQFIKTPVMLDFVGTSIRPQVKKLKQFTIPPITKYDTLNFDSRFESGNLHCVFKNRNSQQYICFVQNDTNSRGYNQWFYFAISSVKAGVKYRLKLVNFRKRHSFFREGYRPAVWSEKEGWRRDGQNVKYGESRIKVEGKGKYFCLEFQISGKGLLLIAMNFPYSYSKLSRFLGGISQKNENPLLKIQISSIAKTLSQNDVPQLTLTSKTGSENKRVIIIMARQHPGEVWSSYMMQGVIQSFLSPTAQNQWLLHNFVIKIYPMVNVDGVIYGNFRCDLTGMDMNRRWRQTNKLFHPQISAIKKKIQQCHMMHGIDLCLDLHAHSKSYNIFSYSCRSNMYTCRILPMLMSQLNENFFFPSCTFGIHPYKQTTARACIYRMIQNQNVLTIETSFYGFRKNNQIVCFQPYHIFEMGKDLMKACQQFLDRNNKKYKNVKKQIQINIEQYLEYDQINENGGGSDSQPSADEIDFKRKMQTIFNNKILSKETDHQQARYNPTKRREKKFDGEKSQQLTKNKNKMVFLRHHSPMTKKFLSPPKINNSQSIQKKMSPEPRKKPINKIQKKTISYSQHKNYQERKKETKPPALEKNYNRSKIIFRQKIKNFALNRSFEGEKHFGKLLVDNTNEQNDEICFTQIEKLPQPCATKQKQINKGEEDMNKFIKKFQKFIPSSIKSQRQENFLEEKIYNEDQSHLITKLLENKRKLEKEKIKYEVERSTNIVERQGKIKIKQEVKKDSIIDFRKFKQNSKVSKKIRELSKNDGYLF